MDDQELARAAAALNLNHDNQNNGQAGQDHQNHDQEPQETRGLIVTDNAQHAEDYWEAEKIRPRKKTPTGDIYSAARAGDVERLRYLIEEEGFDVNTRDRWDSVPLYYTCLAGHEDAARLLLEAGAVCSEYTFDGDRCHYAALNLRIREILKVYEARPPPLDPLARDLRECAPPAGLLAETLDPAWPPDFYFHCAGKSLGVHKAILAARSPYFHRAFATKWQGRKEVRLGSEALNFPALSALVQFCYTDRLDIAVDDLEGLVTVCKVCGLKELQEAVEKEVHHQTYAEYKWTRLHDTQQKRFILQASSLSESARLPQALSTLLHCTQNLQNNGFSSENTPEPDFADLILSVDYKNFRVHQVVLAARSEYFRALFSRTGFFQEGNSPSTSGDSADLQIQKIHDISARAFEKVLEFVYTDKVGEVEENLAVEIFDAAARFLIFSLKRAAAESLMPRMESAGPKEICYWLLAADVYSVVKLREHCLDLIATNFETFARMKPFRSLVKSQPPLTAFVDKTERTSKPQHPGHKVEEEGSEVGGLLEDLREKWLEVEGSELEERDESAAEFDRWMEELRVVEDSESDSD